MGLKQIRMLGFIHSWSSTSIGDNFWPIALNGSITASTWIGDSSMWLTIALFKPQNTKKIRVKESIYLQLTRNQPHRKRFSSMCCLLEVLKKKIWNEQKTNSTVNISWYQLNCYREAIKEKKMLLAHLCSAFNNSKRTDSLLLVRADIADDTPIIAVLRNSLAIVKDVHYMVSDEISNQFAARKLD